MVDTSVSCICTGGRSHWLVTRSPLPTCRYLAALREALRQHAVVELGCGAAPAGLVAARHAAGTVLTDADKAVLRLAAASARLNEATCRAPPRVARLPWGERFARHGCLPKPLQLPGIVGTLHIHAITLSAAFMVWHLTRSAFDRMRCLRRELDGVVAGLPAEAPLLVLGCDLVYYGSGVPDLMWTVAQLLQRGATAGSAQHGGGSWAVLSFTPRLVGWMEVRDPAVYQAVPLHKAICRGRCCRAGQAISLSTAHALRRPFHCRRCALLRPLRASMPVTSLSPASSLPSSLQQVQHLSPTIMPDNVLMLSCRQDC